MTNFSTNQVMQLYVLEGTPKVKKSLTGDYALVQFTKGAEVVATSDKIENVMYGKLAKADALFAPYKVATLTFKADVNEGAPVSGQDYIVRVSYPEIGGLGNEGWTTKTASVHNAASADAAYTELAEVLNAAFAADGVLKAENKGGLVITQTDAFKEVYKAGLRPVKVVDFTVTSAPVIVEGEDVTWAEVVETASTEGITSGYKVADMEYFALGERGDQYRNVDYINAIPTEYKVDPTEEYDVLTVHYAYKGANQNSHKSEKDLVVVATKDSADLVSLAQDLAKAFGVKFTIVPSEGDKKEGILPEKA